MSTDEARYAVQLKEARQSSAASKKSIKKMVSKAAASKESVRILKSMVKQIDLLNDWPMFLALGMAVLKEVVDFIAVTGIFWVFTAVISVCMGIFIFMMMILAGAGQKRRAANMVVKRIMVIGAGTITEVVMPIIPITSVLTVLVTYAMMLMERMEQE